MTVRAKLVRGLVSGVLHEVVLVVAGFASMIVLVRLLTPEQYGEVAATVGLLALIGAFRGAMFVEHALQHARGEEPDWDTYFLIVGTVQVTLFVVTLGVALVCRQVDAVAALAPLLQVAAFGFLLDWPAQVAHVKLRRELRFDRLKFISSIAALLKLTSAVLLAWLGFGAMALVISGNVLVAVPMALSFLLIERWRPQRGWSLMRMQDVRPILRFGSQQIAIGFVHGLRTAAEGVILTSMFGAATFGLLNRAYALYQSTMARLGQVFVETAYPLLPMERADPVRYAHRASRFLEAALILSVPGATFIAIEGKAVSRLLYGVNWAGADPFLAPAAVAVAATGLVSAASHVIMGMGRMRLAVTTESTAALTGIVALIVAVVTTNPIPYVWALAILQIGAAGVAFFLAAPFLEPEWRRSGLWPALAATAAGVAGVTLVRSVSPEGGVGLLISASTYAFLVIAVLAVTARPLMLEVMRTRKTYLWRPADEAPVPEPTAQVLRG